MELKLEHVLLFFLFVFLFRQMCGCQNIEGVFNDYEDNGEPCITDNACSSGICGNPEDYHSAVCRDTGSFGYCCISKDAEEKSFSERWL